MKTNSSLTSAPLTIRPQLKISTERRRPFRICYLDLEFENLPEAFHNCRIVQLTDLHYGPGTSKARITQMVALTVELNPDLIVFTGDYVQYSVTGAHHILAARVNPNLFGWANYRRAIRAITMELRTLLEPLRAPDGILGIFGNHDNNERLGTIQRKLDDKIRSLKNSAALIKKQGSSIAIYGTDDFKRGSPDLAHTLRHPDPFHPPDNIAVKILLAHNPDITLLPHGELLSSVHLILCGHTHGGQIRIPGLPPLLSRTKQRRHIHELSYTGDTPLYISNGVGQGGIPIRVFCPPEIVLVTLKRA